MKKQVNNLHFCQNCNTFHSKTTSCSLVLSECLSPKDPSAGKIKPYTGRTCRTLGKLVFRVVGSSQVRTCMLLIRYGLHCCKEQFSSWKVKTCKISLAITYSLSSLNQNCRQLHYGEVGPECRRKEVCYHEGCHLCCLEAVECQSGPSSYTGFLESSLSFRYFGILPPSQNTTMFRVF